MLSLRGKTVAITEGRRGPELAKLVVNLGGVPYAAPAVREVARGDLGPARAILDRIGRGEVAIIVFFTGVGARAFLDLAATAEARGRLLDALKRMQVVARGPKPVVVLRQAGVRIDLVPAEPTSEGLLAALAPIDLSGRTVAIQLHGDEHSTLSDALRTRGAEVLEIPLYEWALPEDVAPVEGLIRELLAGRIDVVAFTSSPQVKHLFVVAERLGVAERLTAALVRATVAVVGPVCEAAVRERGVTPAVRAAKGTMGALVHAIAEHVASEDGHGVLSDRA